MSWANKIIGWVTGYGVEVDVHNNMLVRTPIVPEQAGYVWMAGMSDDGLITGTPDVRMVRVSDDGRLATGETSILWTDTFNATIQNTSNYIAPVTTQTVTYGGGFVVLNGSSITTLSTDSTYQTRRYFPIFGFAELDVDFALLYTVAPQVNEVREAGLFTAALPGRAAPTDGIFFRWNASGVLLGVISYNGTEITTAGMTMPSANVTHTYDISFRDDDVDFFIDDVLYATLAQPGSFSGRGEATMSPALPFTVRYYTMTTGPSLASQTKISDVNISVVGPAVNKPWASQMALLGNMGYQTQNGTASAQTSSYVNNTAPTAAALTNTTAAAGTGLGGQFAVLPTLTVNQDGILCSYQNPAPTTLITARTLVITGIKIQGAVSVILAGGPVTYEYALAFGHTALSLVTGEAATTKAPRRLALGFENYAATAAVGTLGQGVTMTFFSPVIVNAGEFVAVTAKNIGVVTTTGAITFTVTFDAYYE